MLFSPNLAPNIILGINARQQGNLRKLFRFSNNNNKNHMRLYGNRDCTFAVIASLEEVITLFYCHYCYSQSARLNQKVTMAMVILYIKHRNFLSRHTETTITVYKSMFIRYLSFTEITSNLRKNILSIRKRHLLKNLVKSISYLTQLISFFRGNRC